MKMIILGVIALLISCSTLTRPPKLPSVTGNGVDHYASAHLDSTGLSKEIFEMALKGMHRLDSMGLLSNPNILTIIDYEQSSNKKRLYVIDVKYDTLLFHTWVAHGRNTGDEFAKSFSNEEGSLKSSLGFYITGNTFTGSHTGLSLTIKGVEKGFNDRAEKRAIIIHSASYVTERFITHFGRLGRSFGCPVVPPDQIKPILETIGNGTVLFIYYPDRQYLSTSSLLK